MVESIFAEILTYFKDRRYDKFTSDFFDRFFKHISFMVSHNVIYDYVDFVLLRDWIQERIEKKFKFQETGYLNEHAAIAAVWGALQVLNGYIEEKNNG